jgi:ABC-type dipeptide/oligopeptide/nickel transport system ATPase subunit
LDKSEASKSAVVAIEDLVLKFKKRKEKSVFQRLYTAVNHLNFYVPQGSCFGLLGTYNCPSATD